MVVPEARVVRVPVEVTVKVDEELVRKGELAVPNVPRFVALSSSDKLIYVTELYHHNSDLAEQCYSQLDEIAELE